MDCEAKSLDKICEKYRDSSVENTHRVSGERTRRGGNGGCITHLGSSDVHPSDWFVIYLHNLVAHADQTSLVRGATPCNILQAGNGEGGRAD